MTVTFQDYSNNDFTPTAAALSALRTLLAKTTRDDEFGNARFVRNLFEASVVRQGVAPAQRPISKR